MTERLSQLLHDEADRLDVPPVAVDTALTRGRGLRRRRRLTAGGSILAVGVLAATALVASMSDDRGDHTIADSGPGSYAGGGAFSVGSTVHFGDTGDFTTRVDGKVKSLYYTSAGVVVRTGTEAFTDSAGPSHYALITPAGEVNALDIDLGDRVPATEAGSPYFAYATARGADSSSAWEVVVLDVESGDEVARVPVDGRFAWGGWEAPPVSIEGDTVYVGLDDTTLSVNWRTGRVEEAEVFGESSVPGVAGGRTVLGDRREVRVVDIHTGEVLLQVPSKGYPYIVLSPNGRYAKVVLQEFDERLKPGQISGEEGFVVHDLDTGESRVVDQKGWDLGWTPDGHFLEVTKSGVTTCEPISGDCETTRADFGDGTIKLGGISYES